MMNILLMSEKTLEGLICSSTFIVGLVVFCIFLYKMERLDKNK
jgi:hypothetical protein